MISRVISGLALLASLGALPACAHSPWVALQVVDRASAQTLETYAYHGQSYVAGAPGQRYALRLTNHSAERVLVVLAVDGVNVVSGETAAYGQTGYVLEPWQSADVTGWRKSMGETAAFYFTELGDSYAARTARPDNVGVIGAAVFRERAAPVISNAWPRPSRVEDGASAPSAEAAGRAMDAAKPLGTGHGEREDSPVESTAFERASNRPAEVLTLRYDSYEHLVAAGVIPHYPGRPHTPQAFPGGFVPDPWGR